MKNFFNTTDIDTISESLNGEKFLTASRNEDGCIMLGFESANEDYVDTLTIKHDGSVVGACSPWGVAVSLWCSAASTRLCP